MSATWRLRLGMKRKIRPKPNEYRTDHTAFESEHGRRSKIDLNHL